MKLFLQAIAITVLRLQKKTNAIVPFVRPAYLSEDKALSSDVIDHVINYLRDNGSEYDLFVLLEPTSPLRDSKDVDKAIEYMMSKNLDHWLVYVKLEDQHPSFMFKINETGELSTWSESEFKAMRRQDISSTYFLEGSIYISYIEDFFFFSKKNFCHDMTGGYIVPKWKSFEIDDIVDFICVEAVMLEKDLILKIQVIKNR